MSKPASPVPPWRAILGTIALEPNRWTGKRNPRFTLQELMPAAREYGFDKLEVWQWHVSNPYLREIREIREQADQLGMRFPYIGVYPSFILADADAREEARIQADILDKAELLGVPALKIMLGVGLKGGQATPDQVALTAERFGAWYAAAKARNIAMAVELHGGSMFDPLEAGLAFMALYPALDFSICFQPYDFTDTDKALALADRFAGRIRHMHLQAPTGNGVYDLLEEGALDYRRILPHIRAANPDVSMTLEFVKDCIQNDRPFDLGAVLENARRDAIFVEQTLAGGRA